MNESASMLRYLAQKYPSLNKLYDGSLENKQEIDALLDWNATIFRPAMVSKIQPKFMMMINKLTEPTPEMKVRLDSSAEKVQGALDGLEAILTKKGTKFLNGDAPSIADFQIYAEFGDVFYMSMDFSKWAKITAWHEACRATAGIKEIHEQWDTVVPMV